MVWEFHKDCANGAPDGFGVGIWEVIEAGLAGGMATGEDTWNGGNGVVWLHTHRTLRWLSLFHGGVWWSFVS